MPSQPLTLAGALLAGKEGRAAPRSKEAFLEEGSLVHELLGLQSPSPHRFNPHNIVYSGINSSTVTNPPHNVSGFTY